MTFLLNHFHRITATVGFFCWFLAANTSDMYTMELGEAEPASVGTMMIVGTVLMIPMGIHLIRNYWKENAR